MKNNCLKLVLPLNSFVASHGYQWQQCLANDYILETWIFLTETVDCPSELRAHQTSSLPWDSRILRLNMGT